MTVLLLRYLPWLLSAAALFGAGAWTGNALNPWHGRYQSLQVADAQQRAEGEAAVRKALSVQLAQAQATAQHNADVVTRLAHENAQTVSDRAATLTRVRRLEQLLASAAARSAPSAGVSQAGGGPGTAGAGGDPGPTEIERLLVDARDEAQRNALRLNALIAEISPQIEVP